ncbi:MAG: hypothetical protein EBW87_00185 [Burkholderiaceae bacterium]|nr:hypothetical protein [Burkholderiaceae bacterium]
MKLAVIYNVWDGVELLPSSIKCVKDHADEIIIVWQDISNYGEPFDPTPFIMDCLDKDVIKRVRFVRYEPNVRQSGALNEKAKRNLGISIATIHKCTHFIHMDCDEFYDDFGKSISEYKESGQEGSVCKIYTYFKHPTWRFERHDGYFVPFIHKLRKDSVAGLNSYPFYVDPTRTINALDVALIPTVMHHYSWVRHDINRKVRNSSARKQISKSDIISCYENLECGPGFFVTYYGQKLIKVDDTFDLSNIFR